MIGRYKILVSQMAMYFFSFDFSLLCIFLLCSITDKTFTDLTMSNTAGVLQGAGTAYSLRAPGFTPGFLVCFYFGSLL